MKTVEEVVDAILDEQSGYLDYDGVKIADIIRADREAVLKRVEDGLDVEELIRGKITWVDTNDVLSVLSDVRKELGDCKQTIFKPELSTANDVSRIRAEGFSAGLRRAVYQMSGYLSRADSVLYDDDIKALLAEKEAL